LLITLYADILSGACDTSLRVAYEQFWGSLGPLKLCEVGQCLFRSTGHHRWIVDWDILVILIGVLALIILRVFLNYHWWLSRMISDYSLLSVLILVSFSIASVKFGHRIDYVMVVTLCATPISS
jgi:hypothetical protein